LPGAWKKCIKYSECKSTVVPLKEGAMLRIRISFLDAETAREQVALVTGKEVLVEDPRSPNILSIVSGDEGDIKKLEDKGFELEVWKED
jgi:hypothetical protein